MAAPYTAAPVLSAVGVVYEVDGARLLDGVSLCARQGEFVGLVGPNGAGKTTLLRAVSGVLRRSAGSVALEGRDLDSLSAGEVARTVAHVPQDPGRHPPASPLSTSCSWAATPTWDDSKSRVPKTSG